MTDILEFIKLQRSKGLSDYAVLQATKKMTSDLLNSDTTGGKHPKKAAAAKAAATNATTAQVKTPTASPSSGNNKSDNFNDLQNSIEAKASEFQKPMGANNFNSTQNQQIANDAVNSPGKGDKNEDKEEEQINDKPSNIINEPPQPEKSKKTVQTFITLEKGMTLFHPSQDVKQFSDAMIFVELPKVLDKTKQRSFTMFFTPNMEYARRFSGLWSLNKRTVYVHKMVVDKPITGIQVMNAGNESDKILNVKLAQGKCGSSEDGFINGMKVSYPTEGGKDIDEYYICNPDMFFKHVDSWAQFSPTEWVKITDKEKISVADNKDEVTTESMIGKTTSETPTNNAANINKAAAIKIVENELLEIEVDDVISENPTDKQSPTNSSTDTPTTDASQNIEPSATPSTDTPTKNDSSTGLASSTDIPATDVSSTGSSTEPNTGAPTVNETENL